MDSKDVATAAASVYRGAQAMHDAIVSEIKSRLAPSTIALCDAMDGEPISDAASTILCEWLERGMMDRLPGGVFYDTDLDDLSGVANKVTETVWSDEFAEGFQRRRGKSPTDHLEGLGITDIDGVDFIKDGSAPSVAA
jgi:hypothetical protein